MKHLTVEGKDLLIGDEAAGVLTEYAALVARKGDGDHVELRAYGSDGDDVVVSILLSSGTTLISETSHNTLAEPDNADGIAYMREKIRQATSPPSVQPDAELGAYESQFDEL